MVEGDPAGAGVIVDLLAKRDRVMDLAKPASVLRRDDHRDEFTLRER